MFVLGPSTLYSLHYSLLLLMSCVVAFNIITAYIPSRISRMSSILSMLLTVLVFGKLVAIKTYDVANLQALAQLVALYIVCFCVIFILTMFIFMILATVWVKDGRNGAPTPFEYSCEVIKHAKASIQKTSDQKSKGSKC